MELTPVNAGWAFVKGVDGSYKFIASLELFATLICVILFVPRSEEKHCHGVITLSGQTDNSGNTYVVNKLMSTKFPLNVILMELTEQLDARGAWLDLFWKSRNANVEADALSNFDVEGFDLAFRQETDIVNYNWLVMSELLVAGQVFEEAKAVHQPLAGTIARRPGKKFRELHPWQ